MDFRALHRRLKLLPENSQALQKVLEHLEREGKIKHFKKRGYALISPRAQDEVTGTIQVSRKGEAVFINEKGSDTPVPLQPSALRTALHGDKVLLRVEPPHRGRGKSDKAMPRAEVVKILQRARIRFVGTLVKGRKEDYVEPDDSRIRCRFCVPPDLAGAGEKVVVEMLPWENCDELPGGRIVEVLGAPDASGVDMLSIMHQYGLPTGFPENVLKEASALDAEAHRERKSGSADIHGDGREDCRSHTVFTIDPDDAKDFDDALAIERESENKWRLWVHIADVSHFVRTGSALDTEARRRGNSTYMVDRVVPMLPEVLSNGLCSLKPDVDRLTRCAEFLISDDGKVLKTRFYAATIRSSRRFTYGEAMEILRRKPVSLLENRLHDLSRLAQNIRRKRMANGSLDLDFPETKIRLDDRGRVSGVDVTQNDASHQLVEECMLLANEAVARNLQNRLQPSLFRIHEDPDQEKLDDYREEVRACRIQCGHLASRVEMQRLLAVLKTHPMGKALRIRFLRTMKRAYYSPNPTGHFGLAKTYYTHFTSPIRRYADLVVHRALFEKKKGGASGGMEELGKHLSSTERNSAEAEQDSKRAKLLTYLEELGKQPKKTAFDAMIVECRPMGCFVDVEAMGISGLVPASILRSAGYHCVSGRWMARRGGPVLETGSRTRVSPIRVDREKKQVDFTLATEV